MLGWFVMGAISIATFITIAVVGVSLVSAGGSSQSMLETQRRLVVAQLALEERMGTAGGFDYLLPAGVQAPAGQGYRLPADLPVTAVTPFGRSLLYCPFGPSAGTGGVVAQVRNPNNSFYEIGVVDGFVVRGRPDYAGVSENPDLMGFVLAPIGRRGDLPSCDEVVANEAAGGFAVPDGIVRPISRSRAVSEDRNNASKEPFIFVSPGGSAASDGREVGAPTTVQAAAQWISRNRPEFVTVHFLPGTYDLTSNPLSFGGAAAAVKAARGRMSLVGSGTVLVRFSGDAVMSHYADLFIRNINFGTRLRVEVGSGRRLSVVGSQVGSVFAVGGDVLVENSLVTGTTFDFYTVLLNGGRMQVAASSFGHVGGGPIMSLVEGADVEVIRGNVHFYDSNALNGASPIFALRLRPNSRFSMEGGTLSFSGSYVIGPVSVEGGTLSLVSVDVASDVQQDGLITLQTGGRAVLHESTVGVIGVRPAVGVRDFSGLAVGGAARVGAGVPASVRARDRCWTGALFDSSAVGVTGAVSTPVANASPEPVLSPQPTKAEVVLLREFREDQMRREAALAFNKSAWTCVIVP